MSEPFGERFALESADEHTIHGTNWRPDGNVRAVIQIFHGLGEYHERYTRFARLAVEHDFVVVSHDHRGHGSNAPELGYFADQDGWQKLVDDGLIVAKYARASYSDVPIVLLGHSMGSYIAQAYTMQHPESINALILSASTWPDKRRLIAGHWLARFESKRHGRHGRSPLLHRLGFDDFNKPFEPARTELDWLSRDEREVDAYIADPLCGGPYTCALWVDLLGGLRTITNHAALQRIPAELPILMTGGSDDPVGGQQGIAALARHYKLMGHTHITARFFDGGRHEMFNETNRDEFCHDTLNWIERALPAVART